jgi:hypothetical protein
MGDAPTNGWDVWFYEDEEGGKKSINELRERLIQIERPRA